MCQGLWMREITLHVDGFPPAKNEAKSMLAAGHQQSIRVLALLRAAQDAVGADHQTTFWSQPLALDVTLRSPMEPAADATNYLGGIADVLEHKGRRGPLEHLGELASVALYNNDRQIHEVHYEWTGNEETAYTVRLRVR